MTALWALGSDFVGDFMKLPLNSYICTTSKWFYAAHMELLREMQVVTHGSSSSVAHSAPTRALALSASDLVTWAFLWTINCVHSKTCSWCPYWHKVKHRMSWTFSCPPSSERAVLNGWALMREGTGWCCYCWYFTFAMDRGLWSPGLFVAHCVWSQVNKVWQQ